MTQNIETYLEKIQKLAKQREEENWKFRAFLKRSDYSLEKIDQTVHALLQEVSSRIDCTKCGNCCRKIRPVLNCSDIERFAKGLAISANQFKERYLVKCKGKRNSGSKQNYALF